MMNGGLVYQMKKKKNLYNEMVESEVQYYNDKADQ